MNLFTPKSYFVRHSILRFLSDERRKISKDDRNKVQAAFTISRISKELNIDKRLIDEQLDSLYHLKQIDIIQGGLDENKFIANEAGMYANSIKSSLNEGKLLNSQIISNYTNSFFQILTGFIALYTIYKSYTTVDAQNVKIEQLQQSILKMEKQLKNQQQLGLNLNQDTLQLNRPPNVQKSSYKLDTLK